MNKSRITIINNFGKKKRVVINGDITGGFTIPCKTGNYITHSYGDGRIDIEKYIASSDSWRKIHAGVEQCF